MLFLGIDGGGTKTEFVLCDEDAIILARLTKESASHWQVSKDKIKEVILSGTKEVLRVAHKSFDDLTAIGYGMSGLGEDLKKDAISINVFEEIFTDRPQSIRNDGEIGLIASFGGEVGINVVAGTGSISFGMDEHKKVARCGGWGHELGDEGSGYWLGNKLLEFFSKQSDGRLVKTKLYDLVKEAFNIDYDFDIMTIIQDEYFSNRTKTASLQQILCQAAKANDPCALSAYKQAVDELVSLVLGVKNQLNYTGEIRVSYSGGIFKAGDFVTRPFINKLEAMGFVCCKPLFEPYQGALILAAKLVGYDQELIKKLRQI